MRMDEGRSEESGTRLWTGEGGLRSFIPQEHSREQSHTGYSRPTATAARTGSSAHHWQAHDEQHSVVASATPHLTAGLQQTHDDERLQGRGEENGAGGVQQSGRSASRVRASAHGTFTDGRCASPHGQSVRLTALRSPRQRATDGSRSATRAPPSLALPAFRSSLPGRRSQRSATDVHCSGRRGGGVLGLARPPGGRCFSGI